ncbi:lysozyme [Nodosilinea sp. FACHB-13]|uniref:lysozyme n=1 Tax=Cyanophyceae TaxID=3028117 RepID=UPI001686782E|nr:lysozyme [Nodosilinea sp. FACHB-13]MBD2107525.1 lysozyme [Nodosilinea sp. FACHB-13]
MDDDKLPPVWQKILMLSGLAASILVPLSIGMVGHSNRSIQANNMGLRSVDVLGEPPRSEAESLGKWAVSLINGHSHAPLPEVAQQEKLQPETPGVELVATFEGAGLAEDGKIYPYDDGLGNQIIGYGHLIQPQEHQSGTINIDGELVPFARGISQAQAKTLLDQDLKPIRQKIDDLVTVELVNNQRDALASFVYNIGLQAFEESTLLKKLNAGEYDAVPAELMKFTKAGGEEFPGLVNRRKAEVELWNTPDASAQE